MWILGCASISNNLGCGAGNLIEGLMPGSEEALQAARKTGSCTQDPLRTKMLVQKRL